MNLKPFNEVSYNYNTTRPNFVKKRIKKSFSVIFLALNVAYSDKTS